VREAEAARDWYAAQSPRAAAEYLFELDAAFAAILEHPQRWPTHVEGTRRYLLKRFPFGVVYREAEGLVEFLAVAHASREPGYWRRRAE